MSKQYVRRDIVRAIGGVGVVGLAGCLADDETVDADVPSPTDPTATPQPTATPTPETTATPEATDTPSDEAEPATGVTAWGQAYGTPGNTGNTPDFGAVNGTVQWTTALGGSATTAPVVVDRRMFVATRTTLHALDRADGAQLWTRPFDEVVNTPACTADTVLVAADMLYALSPETGEPKWTSTVGGGPVTDLTVGDGVVYFGAADAKVYGLSIADGSRVARSALFPFGDVRTPATDGESIFVAAASSVVGLNIRGAQMWEYDAGSTVVAPPVVAGDTVYVGVTNGNVVGIDRVTGAVRWTTNLGGSVSTPATVGDGGLFAVTGDTLVKLEPGTGRVEWSERVSDASLTAVAQATESLYIGSAGHRVYALDPTNGAVRWSKKTGKPVVGGPAVVGDAVYTTTSGGTVTAFA